MSKLNWWKATCILCAVSTVVAINSSAQVVKTLANFDSSTGTPYGWMALVQGIDGNLYGTTYLGGAFNNGSVFKVTPTGVLSTLYSFCTQGTPPNCLDGEAPWGGLVQAGDGNLYGTNTFGGPYGLGVVFKITAEGAESTVSAMEDAQPAGALIQAANGSLYGTTGHELGYFGTIFDVPLPPTQSVNTIYTFCMFAPNCDGGDDPSALMQATDGTFYGTNQTRGLYGDGTVFGMTSSGSVRTLHTFGGTDGSAPMGPLVQATDGNLYGTTAEGGANGNGTVFKITPKGVLTTLHSFDLTDGAAPSGGLVQATDGNLYGTAAGGGANGGGTLFRITPGGTLTTLYNFCAEPDCSEGYSPSAALFQATDGKFYGATVRGGANNDGAIYSLNVDLGPFVETVPAAGKVGRSVLILGTNLTGATSVTFNGTPAEFTVSSATLINANVPAGATTGKVEVVTPGGTLSSNQTFQVMP
jgi:uncharacterized repeat protein (TIGR03803 family)